MLNSDDPLQIESTAFKVFLKNDDVFAEQDAVKYKPQRKSVRYVRKDITASISQSDIFGGYNLFASSRVIRVKLLDISSRGSLIGGPSKLTLKIGQKVMLTLIFKSNKKFEIPAKVMRKLVDERTYYGIKFDSVNDELGDHLLETQSDLVFK